jgi:hypothetical protein
VAIWRDGRAIAIIIIKPGQSCGNGSDEFFSVVEGRSRSVGEAYIAPLHLTPPTGER